MENENQLNLTAIQEKMKFLGFNNSSLAEQLGVTREIVSKWVTGKKNPRPRHMLELAKTLSLKFEEIIIPDLPEPIIAFRKRGRSKTTKDHVERAKQMGESLKSLLPYLPFDISKKPAVLLNPKNEFNYIKRIVKKLREDLNLSDIDVFQYEKIIELFKNYHAVLIPVLWGVKDYHENAIHIYLPDSMTTWIYLNLEVEKHDFKFWMAHELGHVLATDLIGDEGEDFADSFAAELLFPSEVAEHSYKKITQNKTESSKISYIKNIAKKYEISPYTVYSQVNLYAKTNGLQNLELKAIHGAAKNFNKSFPKISEIIFNNQTPDVSAYIYKSEKLLQTSFFKSLKKFILSEEVNFTYLKDILKISIPVAKEIYDELKNGSE